MRWLVVLCGACGGSASPDLVAIDGDGAGIADVQFADTATGLANVATVRLENRGDAETGTIAVGTSGDFLVADSTTCQGITLAPDSGCDIVIEFHPSTDGLRTGALVVTTTPGSSLSIPLTGMGVTGMLQLDPTMLALGGADIGASVESAIHVTNTSAVPVPLQGITVSGAGFTEGTTTCANPIDAHGSCDVGIMFTPIVLGAANGMAVLHSGGTDYGAQLAGIGTSALTVVIAGNGSVTSVPAGIDCGATCTASFSDTIQLTAVAATGSRFASWSDAACTTATCALAASPSPRTITATFTQESVFLSPGTFDFGTVDTSIGPVGTLQLVNDTSSAISIDAIAVTGARFVFTGTTCGIALGANTSCDVNIRFRARSIGAQSGTLDVTANGQHHIAQITGVGELPITVTVQGAGTVLSTPAGIDCGATCAGLFSGPVTLAATPDPGEMFGTWSSACGTNPTCVVNPGDTVTASFVTAGSPSVNVVFAGNATGEVRVFDITQNAQLALCTTSCAVSLTNAHTIEVTGGTISNYGGLSGACTANTTTSHCQFQALGPTTLTAHFDKAAGERWTRFIAVPGLAPRFGFDPGGNVVVVQTNSITKLDATDGGLLWSRQLPIDSFVIAGSAVYVASAGNLLLLDAGGNTQASHPFTGTIDFLAPNGNLLGNAGASTNEYDPNGSLVRTLPFVVSGIDSSGTFYTRSTDIVDEGGEPVSHMSASRHAFDGTPMTSLDEVAPPTGREGCSGFEVGDDHVVGYLCGHRIGQIGIFGWESHAPSGTLEAAINHQISSSTIMIGAAVPAGPNIAFYEVPTDFNAGAGVRIGVTTPGMGTTTTLRDALEDPMDFHIGITMQRIVGGPSGFLLFGTYSGLFDATTEQHSGGTFIQTFYP